MLTYVPPAGRKLNCNAMNAYFPLQFQTRHPPQFITRVPYLQCRWSNNARSIEVSFSLAHSLSTPLSQSRIASLTKFHSFVPGYEVSGAAATTSACFQWQPRLMNGRNSVVEIGENLILSGFLLTSKRLQRTIFRHSRLGFNLDLKWIIISISSSRALIFLT